MCLFNIICNFFCFYFFRVLCLFGRVFGENGDVFVFGDYYIEVWIEVFVYLLYIFVLWSCWYGICVLFLLYLCYWVNLREFGIVLLYFLLDIDEYWLFCLYMNMFCRVYYVKDYIYVFCCFVFIYVEFIMDIVNDKEFVICL